MKFYTWVKNLVVVVSIVFTSSLNAAEIDYSNVTDQLVTGTRDELMSSISTDLRAQLTSQVDAIEMFLDSNTLDCLNLYIEGICVWFVVNCGWTGCSVSIQPYAKIGHYNPDFMVSSYPRIGASPINEVDRLYDGIQTEVSKSILELLSDEDVPATYKQEHQFGGANLKEATGERDSGAIYSEVEVIGHPGNIISLSAKAMNGQIVNDAEAFVDAQVNLLSNIATQATNQVQAVVNEVNAGGANIIDGEVGNTAEWSAPSLGDTSDWVGNVMEPVELAILNVIGDVTEAYGQVNDAISDLTSGELTDQAITILEQPGEFVTEYITGLDEYSQTEDAISDAGTLLEFSADAGETLAGQGFNGQSAEQLLDNFNDLELEDLGTEVQEATEAISDFVSGDQAQFGVGDYNIDLTGGLTLFCPSKTVPLMPYYLSGLNVLSWRMQVPEMAYPRSYAFPLPGTSNFIGRFNGFDFPDPVGSDGNIVDWASDITFPDWSTWSNLYPRSGWVIQNDEAKARAVAAFRATHIVTRGGQSHLYRQVAGGNSGRIRMWNPPPLDINNEESGSWQMMYPHKQNECSLLPNTGLDPGLISARDPELTSANGAYVFNVWRRYECCYQPRGDISDLILDIPIRIPIIP